ncbi:MAG: cysteine desulfurase [Planctomycetaceae bacterium]|jgi:cysteine desulfurase|nr:cysteine desulfurase [Planctomycetaceae bacterium]
MIYADNAATTKISANVLCAMLPLLSDEYGNPSSIYDFGGRARRVIELSRVRVAEAVGANPREIYFTSGGTESDNWAIKGTASICRKKNKTHIISTTFEHHAVMGSLEFLRRSGFEVTFLDVGVGGIIDPAQLREAIRPDTGFVTIMFANNEIGTIQPIAELGEICRSFDLLFHTDAVQAVGELEIDLGCLPVDLLSVSGHKIHAAKGVGVLYIRDGVEIAKFMDGGDQERGYRAGTENTAAIAGMGVAMQDTVEGRESRIFVTKIRDRFIDGVLKLGNARIHGDRKQRLSGNANIGFDGIDGELVVLMLNRYGICCSTGSACGAGAIEASHVIKALGYNANKAKEAVRFTFSNENTVEEIDYILDKLKEILNNNSENV